MNDRQQDVDQNQCGEQTGQDAAPSRAPFMRAGESIFDVIGRIEAQKVAAEWFASQAAHGSDSA